MGAVDGRLAAREHNPGTGEAGSGAGPDVRLVIGLTILALAVRCLFLYIAPNNSTDAWARYRGALAWTRDPSHLPPPTATDAWLPLHFWLLGIWLRIWNSETGARALSVLLGSLTIPPYWGVVRRAFGGRVAAASTLLFALFGFHIAFSVTTGSEAPTIFLLVSGLYAWTRYDEEESGKWIALAALALGAACLVRFEAWLFLPVLDAMLLDYPRHAVRAWSARRAAGRALAFALPTSAGVIGWTIYSFLKWGDALALPHRTIELRRHFAPLVLRHSPPFHAAVVPASLLVSLSPLLLALAGAGAAEALRRGPRIGRSLAVLGLVLLGFGCFNSLRYDITQVRYTVIYSWLLIPLAFEAVQRLGEQWRWASWPASRGAVVAFFLLWQAGIVAGAAYAPAPLADHLGAVSPTIPLHREMRQLTAWLRGHPAASDPLVVDDFNWESDEIMRFGGRNRGQDFFVSPADYASRARLAREVDDYVARRHPAFVVCSPFGLIGSLWSVDDRPNLAIPGLGIRLRRQWRGKFWSVYAIEYEKDRPPVSEP